MSSGLKEFIKNETIQALFITNALGFSGDLDLINQTCNENNIILIEDNCESLGTEVGNKKTGTFGVAGTHSFYIAHHMSTIEGGMVSTDDEELSHMLKIVRANGWDRNLPESEQKKLRKEYQVDSDFNSKYTFYDLGFNLRPTEITGFLGVQQLKFLNKIVLKRQQNYQFLEKTMLQNQELISIQHDHINVVSSFSIPVIVKDASLINKYIAKFEEAEVEIRPIISGDIQKQPFYKKYVKDFKSLPNASYIHDNGFYFGNYPELDSSELEILANCLSA